MKRISFVYFILIFLPSISLGFTINNINPLPNYSNYIHKDITDIIHGRKKINHKVGRFIGWKNLPYFYFDLTPQNIMDGKICISSLKRNASNIGWPLRILVIEHTGTSLNVLSEIKFSEQYENLIQGTEQKEVCSNVVHITKYTKIAVITSARYTFLGEIELKRKKNEDTLVSDAIYPRKNNNSDISSFLIDYRRRLNTSFEDYFDLQSALKRSASNKENAYNQEIMIWNKPLDDIFRRSSNLDNLTTQTEVFKVKDQLVEVAFGFKNKHESVHACVYPVVSSINSKLEYVKSYLYEGVTGKGKIAERLVFSDRKISVDSDAKEIVIGIRNGLDDKITISFINCESNVLIKKFNFLIKSLPINRDSKIPVLVWPYQNSWPAKVSSQVFDNLSSHYSQIAALQGYYVPRSSVNKFDAFKFNQFNDILPAEFDIYLFPHLQRKSWRLGGKKRFETESDEWAVGQQDWANKLSQLVEGAKRTFYLALVDEPRNDQHFSIANTYYGFFKDRPENLKILTTLSSGMSIASILKTAAKTDILVLEQSLINTMYLKAAKLTGKQVWLYSSRLVGRNRDPLKDYRYLPWKAYINELQGIGIWNYSSNKAGATQTSPIDYDVSGSYYGLVYIEGGYVLSSKRWEAFKRGMEDIMIAKSIETKVDKDRVINVFLETMKNNENGQYLRSSLYQLLFK